MSRIKKEKITLAQANGKEVVLTVSGDEFYARYENDDGFTVVYDTYKGEFCFALLFKGEFVSSGIPVTNKPPSQIRKHLRETGDIISSKFNRRFQLTKPPFQPGPPIPSEMTLGPDRGLLTGPKIH